MSGLAHENDRFDIGARDGLVDFGKVGIVGFVTTTDDKDDILVWKGLNSDASRAGIGRKIVIIEFDTAKLADKFEAVR